MVNTYVVAKAYTQFMLLKDIASGLDDQQLEMLLTKAQDDAETVDSRNGWTLRDCRYQLNPPK